MRPRWIILGLFLAGIVFGTIIWLPERPMWRIGLSRFSDMLAFSEDSKTLLILVDKRKEFEAPIVPYLSRWDAITGKLVSETPISIPEPLERIEYRINSDGTSLIISGDVHRKMRFDPVVFYVIDTASGQKRFGPVECADYSREDVTFSKNGQWIVYSVRDEKEPLSNGGIAIIDSRTGNNITRISHPEVGSIKGTCFAPNASSIALLQWKHKSAEGFSIRIIDLPSGRERHHFPLTKREWERLYSWDDHQLTAFASVPNPNHPEHITKVFTLDLESGHIGQETEHPELERRHTGGKKDAFKIFWQECSRGSNWRAEQEVGDVELDWVWKYCNKCAELLGAKIIDESGTELRLRFRDIDTNRIRYQSPLFVNSTSCIARDGASYAIMTFGGDLSVWNAQPSLRLPCAVVASLGMLLLVLLLGRGRTKRLARSSGASPFPSAATGVELQ